MDLGLKGRNAVVLGGTRGIGRAIAGTLASEGAGVAVCARNADQVATTVAELKAQGVKATGAPVDITDAAALKSWIAGVAKELGGIDMLFSNAGAMAQGGDPASWEQNFRLDVLGAVNAFEAARPFLEASGEKSGDAALVIISSISAAQADSASSYGPIKAALVHMAKGLARQYAAKKIRVNVVSPGTVYFKGGVWNVVEQNMPKRYQDALARNPLGRMATPQEIAGFLVHDRLEPRRRWRDLEPREFLRAESQGTRSAFARVPRSRGRINMKSVPGSQLSATKRSSDWTSETSLFSRYLETTKPSSERQTLS
jgi:3-oxoacyl-[acyl-carrier protein] reductase